MFLKWNHFLFLAVLYFQRKDFTTALNVIEERETTKTNIMNGRMAREGEVPYQVAIVESVSNNFRCSGSIITSKHVLSAGHCFCKYDSPATLKIFGGITELNDFPILRRIKSIKKIEPFDYYKDDIALITVEKDFIFTNLISPVHVYNRDLKKDTACLISGWGKRFRSDVIISNSLYIANTTVVTCPAEERKLLKNGICISSPGDGCRGDSGGPVVCEGRLAGVISMSLRDEVCGDPTYATYVKHYVPWLKANGVDIN
ncbi:chymotrypsin-1-like [Lycorma delicatula]|uniref:chymotrypsin-1-like n=1 Tax=Lycorma delicatula TaxID=130591 RepID=UPI003F50D8E2